MADTIKDDKKKKGGSSKKILLVISALLFLAALTVVYLFVQGKKPAQIPTSNLPVEIIAFCHQRLPELYQTLVALDEEVTRTRNEISRIGQVGDTYPDQKRIAETEMKSWTGNLTALEKGQGEFEKQIEMIYVSVQVNPETGQALIDEKKEELKQKTDELIARSKTMTDKLRAIDEARSFFEKTRDRFTK